MPRRPQRYVLRKPSELEALISPLRHHLMRTLSNIGPCAARDLAAEMGRSPESLYYHLKALEGAGLVVQQGNRIRNGRNEMLYASVAKKIFSDPQQTSSRYLDAFRRSAAALLRLSQRQVTAAILRQQERGSRRPITLRAQQLQARLSPASQRELAQRLDEILEFLIDHDDPEEQSRTMVTLVSAPLHRFPEESPD
jgi:predicted ArsR family transcriptional regulator